MTTPDGSTLSSRAFARRALVAIAIAALVFALMAFVWNVSSGLLVLFICILLAVIFDAAARLIDRYTHIGRKASLGVTIFLLVGLLVVALTTGGVGLFEEMPNLSKQLDQSVAQLNTSLSKVGWIRNAVGTSKPVNNVILMGSRAIGDASNIFSLGLSALADLFIVLVLGIYLSWSPKTYAGAFVKLFPIRRRARIEEVLEASAHALRRWILGQLAAMTMVFVFTTTGLLLLGVNFAFALGAIAGVLTFVPYLGGIVAAVPAIMIAFLTSPLLAAYTALLFLASYTLEGYFFTPLVQQRVVSIAPAFLLVAQLLAADFSGLAGVFVAAPLAVVLTVLIQKFYVEDTLGDLSPRAIENSGDTESAGTS